MPDRFLWGSCLASERSSFRRFLGLWLQSAWSRRRFPAKHGSSVLCTCGIACIRGSPASWHRQPFGRDTNIDVWVKRCIIAFTPILTVLNEWSGQSWLSDKGSPYEQGLPFRRLECRDDSVYEVVGNTRPFPPLLPVVPIIRRLECNNLSLVILTCYRGRFSQVDNQQWWYSGDACFWRAAFELGPKPIKFNIELAVEQRTRSLTWRISSSGKLRWNLDSRFTSFVPMYVVFRKSK